MTIRTGFLTANVAREAKTFPAFAAFPSLPPVQLDGWLSAVKVQVVSAIEWDWPQGWAVGPRVVNDSMFFWFERGSGRAWFGSPANSVDFSAGDILLVPQGVEHGIEGHAGDEPHVYAVHFFASLFGGIDLLKRLGFPGYIQYREGAPYRGICERAVREYAVKPPGWQAALANDVISLLLYLIRMEPERFTPQMNADHESELARLLPVLDWIESHLSSHEITVGDLSRQISISETHFRRMFHKAIGISPVQFIRQRRIERACTLLRTTDMPIKHLAHDCGFAEDAFFSRVFHRLVGTSPAAYRRAELL